jgi:hypothetical protein
MTEVIQFPLSDVPRTLRSIADRIDAGDFPGQTCTLVLDGHNIFTFGHGRIHNDQAGREAVFDLTVGLHRIMHAVSVGIEKHSE